MRTMRGALQARSRQAGISVLEMVIALAVMVLLFGSIGQSMSSMRKLTTTCSTSSRLQRQAERALDSIVADLRLAGRFEVPGVGMYPHVFIDGQPDAGFPADHGHALAPKSADPLDSDFGADREILMILPQDFDGDNNPDINLADHTVLWGMGSEVSYTRRAELDGTNVLARQVSGEAARTIARDVERVEFTAGDALNLDVPLGCVRVRIFFRAVGENGTVQRAQAEATVRMRNTPEEFKQT